MPVRIDNFPAHVDGNVDGGGEPKTRRKNRNNYGVFEEWEKRFELSQGLEIPQRVRRVVRQVLETIQVPPFRAVSYRPEPTDSAAEQHIDST